MTLPDVLEALAVRLPGRLKLTRGNVDVHEGGNWVHVGYLPPAAPLLLHRLEYALREECAARGWGISQKIWNDGSGITTVNVSVPGCPYLPSGKGDTPAEALARALLSALEAQC